MESPSCDYSNEIDLADEGVINKKDLECIIQIGDQYIRQWYKNILRNVELPRVDDIPILRAKYLQLIHENYQIPNEIMSIIIDYIQIKTIFALWKTGLMDITFYDIINEKMFVFIIFRNVSAKSQTIIDYEVLKRNPKKYLTFSALRSIDEK